MDKSPWSQCVCSVGQQRVHMNSVFIKHLKIIMPVCVKRKVSALHKRR